MKHFKILSNCVALLLGCSVALLFGEIFLRIYLGNLDFYAMHDPNLRIANQLPPGLFPGCSEMFRYSTNRQGMRGENYPEGSASYRLLAIGGSTTICSFLDDAKTWPALVQKKLPNTKDGRSFWVGNAGKSGLTSRSHVLQMAYLVPQYEIDAVILLVGINDLALAIWDDDWYDPHFLENAANKHLLIFKTFTVLPDSLYSFHKHFAFWKLARRARSYAKNYIDGDDLVAEIGRSRDLRRHGRVVAGKPDLTIALQEYADNLTRIMTAAQRQKLRLILMTQPVLWRSNMSREEEATLFPFGFIGFSPSSTKRECYSNEVMAECMRLYNDRLMSLCRQFDVECIDLASRLPQNLQVFYDDCHFTRLGGARRRGGGELSQRTAPFRKTSSTELQKIQLSVAANQNWTP
jgi:hypothetical protein